MKSSRLWSLYDMLKKYSTIFSNLMVGLYDHEMGLYGLEGDERDEPLSTEYLEDLVHLMTIATSMAEEMDLDASKELLKRMWGRQKNGYSKSQAHDDIRDLRSRIEDQLKSRLFLFVDKARASYYETPTLFGQQVNDKFPKAIDDIEDAGKALALGLGTSCVMHLMRVMEVGLKALAKTLKIPYAPSWESYLTQIEKSIAAKHPTKTLKWKKDEKFFRDINGDLLVIKQAWRNPTMHIDRRYTVEEAEQIFQAVRTLMQLMATKLKS